MSNKEDIVVSDLYVKELVEEIRRLFILNTETFDIIFDTNPPEVTIKVQLDNTHIQLGDEGPLHVTCRNGVYFVSLL